MVKERIWAQGLVGLTLATCAAPTISEHRRRDAKDAHVIEVDLARFFVVQARRYAGLPQREIQRLRNERDLSMSAALAERDSNYLISKTNARLNNVDHSSSRVERNHISVV